MRRIALVSGLALAAACGGGSGDDGDDQTPDASVDADPAGWTRLIGRTWTVPQGVFDIYRCIRIQVTQDVYITGFRSLAPLGSHHAVLTIANGGTLGEYNCSVNSLDLQMLYAAGIGTDDLLFPDGVGVHIPAGTFLNLNLHLFNAGEVAINGDSAILVRTLPAAPPTLADMTFAGTFNLSLPPNSGNRETTGGCNAMRNYTVLALWPHMHQYGVHQKFEVTRGGVTTTPLDLPFSFTEQTNYVQDPLLEIRTGDRIQVTCTHNNTSSSTVSWGDSSTEEMCFTGMYRFPAGNGYLFECSEGAF